MSTQVITATPSAADYSARGLELLRSAGDRIAAAARLLLARRGDLEGIDDPAARADALVELAADLEDLAATARREAQRARSGAARRAARKMPTPVVIQGTRCGVDWGSATEAQRCIRPDGHDGEHRDASGGWAPATGPARRTPAPLGPPTKAAADPYDVRTCGNCGTELGRNEPDPWCTDCRSLPRRRGRLRAAIGIGILLAVVVVALIVVAVTR